MSALPSFLAAGLATTILAGSSASAAGTDARERKQVTCADTRSFTILSDGKRAQVIWADRHATLPRKPSSLGERYESARAALIIDGAFVAFVPKGNSSWEDCYVSDVRPARYP